MKHTRRSPRDNTARDLRAQRGATAVMAQYVHELSSRHGRFTLRQPTAERAGKTPVAVGGQR